MRTESQTIEYAQGLVRALKAREAATADAIALFEGARSPEARAKAAENLIAVNEQTLIDFNASIASVADRVAARAGLLVSAGRALFGNREPGA